MTLQELSTIYEQMRETFAAEAGFVPSDGCDAMVRLYALSAQVQSLLVQADWVLAQSFPQSAQGQYLDYHAASRGIERTAASKASGTLRFSASAAAGSSYAIAAGTTAMTADGVRFATTENAVLPAGSTYVDVSAQAVEPGAGGNVIAGRVTLLSALPAGIAACTNPAAFSGGRDAEDDETLRGRILESYRRLPNGANAAYYEQEAMRVPGVAAAKAVGRARGIGTVDVYVTVGGGAPDAALLAQIESVLAAKREIAVDVQVLAPAQETVNIAAELSVAEGYDFDAVCDAVEQALGDRFTGALLGRSVLTAELGALIYGIEGVTNCHLLAPSADVSVGATTLPVLGSVTLTQIGG